MSFRKMKRREKEIEAEIKGMIQWYKLKTILKVTEIG